jgi:hypothetical protein
MVCLKMGLGIWMVFLASLRSAAATQRCIEMSADRQCPIAPGSKFTYRFTVDGQYGTYWYGIYSVLAEI